MPSFTAAAATALVAAASVAAHGHVVGVYTSDGEFSQGWDPNEGMGYGDNFPDVVGWLTTVQDNGFVSKESHNNFEIACHRGGEPAALSVEVSAGGVLTLEWDTWPESHHGPVLDYLAACPSSGCAGADKESLSWFKISEVGYLAEDDVWGADLLISNGNKWQVQIPEGIASGEYVLRHEILALHSLGEPQHYPQCVNINVSGGGSDSPSGVLANELYSDYEDFNIYQEFSSYPIPGPKMIEGASPIIDQGSGVGTTPPPAESGDEEEEEEASATESSASGPTATAPVENELGEEDDEPAAPTPVETEAPAASSPVEEESPAETSAEAEVPVPSSPVEEEEEPAPTPSKKPCTRRRRRTVRRSQN